MPRKVRDLIKDLKSAGFVEVRGRGRGSHRIFTHRKYVGSVTLSGGAGDDAKYYQEKHVKQAIEDTSE